MKNVDVAWRLTDVVREGQKLNKMTSMLLWHPGFISVCPNSWVLVTATIRLKTRQKKAFTTFFAEGNITDTWERGKPQKLEFERGNSRVWNHPYLTARAAKKFTLIFRILQLVTSGGITIFRTMPLSHIFHSLINAKFDFWQKQLHWQKIQTPFANSRLFILASITIKRTTIGDCKLLACDGKVRKSRKL